ncbi:hypothetical protein L5D93_13510 [Paenibacillus thiaminolyticus]|nr:hypothetical protein [Paenibacillus thiaminolyticus]
MTQHRRLPLRSCLLLLAAFVLALGGCAKGECDERRIRLRGVFDQAANVFYFRYDRDGQNI